MDDDQRDLIAKLCTAAGMLMEDACPSAVMIMRQDDASVRTTVNHLVHISDNIRVILGAAAALARLPVG